MHTFCVLENCITANGPLIVHVFKICLVLTNVFISQIPLHNCLAIIKHATATVWVYNLIYSSLHISTGRITV